jgi:hypothetical protein
LRLILIVAVQSSKAGNGVEDRGLEGVAVRDLLAVVLSSCAVLCQRLGDRR